MAGDQGLERAVLREQRETDGVWVMPEFALQGEGDVLGVNSFEQGHAESLIEPRANLRRLDDRSGRDDFVEDVLEARCQGLLIDRDAFDLRRDRDLHLDAAGVHNAVDAEKPQAKQKSQR